MLRGFGFLLGLFLCLSPLCGGAFAVEPSEMLKDPALERRARDLSSGLRCLVCQNQSIDDSEAPLAKDLRLLVRQRIAAGESDEQVKSFLVERYGSFILLKPPLEIETLLLWGGPFLVLAFGAILARAASRKRAMAQTAPLDAQEQAELARLLAERPTQKDADAPMKNS